MTEQQKINIDKVLDNGVILRARQQDAIHTLSIISDNRKHGREILNSIYQDFYRNVAEVERILDSYPDKRTPVKIYNHIVKCVERFGLSDDNHFSDLEYKTIK